MTDVNVRLGCVVAYGLWASVLVLLPLAWMLDSMHLASIGLAASAAAATAHIRCFFVAHNRIVRNAVDFRDEAARRLHPMR